MLLSEQDFDKLFTQLSSVVLDESATKKPTSRRKTPLKMVKKEAAKIIYSVSAV